METVLLSEKSQNTERRERAWGLCQAGIHKALDCFPRSKRKRRTKGKRNRGEGIYIKDIQIIYMDRSP